jgi:hypothetical protein
MEKIIRADRVRNYEELQCRRKKHTLHRPTKKTKESQLDWSHLAYELFSKAHR